MRKRKKLLTSALVTVSVLLIISIALLVVGRNYIYDRNVEITELQNEMEANKQVLYVASTFIGRGETIEAGVNVMQQEVYTGLEPYNYIAEEDLGCVATIDIEEKMPIMKNMTAPITIDHDTREYEMRVVNLMSDQAENDIVDVRIMFPTGEDFIVLSKKQVRNLSLEASRFNTYLSEEEILRMASATIDAYTISGTRIYTTRYAESNLQNAAIPNYLVKQETIDLINNDPNVLEKAQETLNKFARLELEERIGNLSAEQLTAISDGHGLEDTAKGQALTSSNPSSTPSAANSSTDIDDEGNETEKSMMSTTRATLSSQSGTDGQGSSETDDSVTEEINSKEAHNG